MGVTAPAGLPAEFWSRAGAAPHTLLMLDYDGTLAPFRIERAEARPYPGVAERLRAIVSTPRTTLAIVSGRPLDELERLFDARGMMLIGEHGWEERGPSGERIRHPLPAAAARALEHAARVASEAGVEAWIERKRTGVVLHTRAIEAARVPAIEAEVAERWRRFADDGPLTLDQVDGGLELRARGHDKGIAAAALIGRCPPQTIPVFVGDDRSDEDAFAVVSAQGFGVRVGAHRESRARLRIESSQLLEFLDQWRLAVATS
jgi:trehalose-phosphatase